jgi:4-hydroxy-tetrahydrodipicolinate synthase
MGVKPATPGRPFGAVLTAMETPFTADGDLDVHAAATLATYLVEQGNDGLVVSGTTGEAPATTDEEKDRLLRVVIDAVGDRAHVVAGVGTNQTQHTIDLARDAEKAGADGLLVVTPYYSKPPQAGLIRHFTAVADATELPCLLYDIPGRTALAIETETLLRLAEHDRIAAVKDAKGDFAGVAELVEATGLAYYSGEDKITLPLLSVGAVGVVGVVTHAFTGRIRQMIEAYGAGDVEKARRLNASLVPAYVGFFRTQAAIMSTAAMNLLGLPGGHVRPPMVDATTEQVEVLRADLAAAGLEL